MQWRGPGGERHVGETRALGFVFRVEALRAESSGSFQ